MSSDDHQPWTKKTKNWGIEKRFLREQKKNLKGGPPPNTSPPVSDLLKAARNQVTWALFKWIGFLEANENEGEQQI
jgi:hypothetical protein